MREHESPRSEQALWRTLALRKRAQRDPSQAALGVNQQEAAVAGRHEAIARAVDRLRRRATGRELHGTAVVEPAPAMDLARDVQCDHVVLAGRECMRARGNSGAVVPTEGEAGPDSPPATKCSSTSAASSATMTSQRIDGDSGRAGVRARSVGPRVRDPEAGVLSTPRAGSVPATMGAFRRCPVSLMNAPDSSPAVPPKSRRDPEFWIAIGALLVSALAMVTSLLQTSIQRNQERAMVWPHLSASAQYSAAGFAMVAANKGLGPALVHRVQLKVDGEPVDDWGAVLDRALGAGHGFGWDQLQVNDVAGTVIGADESRVMFRIPWDERTRKAFGQGLRVEAQLCYCSFLGECWLSGKGLDHARVAACTTPAT